MCGCIGAQTPSGCSGGRRERNGTGAGLFHRPTFAASSGFVEFMQIVVEPSIDQERSIFARIEPEAFDDGHAAFVEDGTLAPGLASIRCQQKKRIAWSALQVGARDPTVLEIDELNLIESSEPDAWMRLDPGFSGVFAGEQYRIERGGCSMQIPRKKHLVAGCFYVAQFEKIRTRLFLRATQSSGLRIGFRAFKRHSHGFAYVFERSLGAEIGSEHNQRGRTKHKFMVPDWPSEHHMKHASNQQSVGNTGMENQAGF